MKYLLILLLAFPAFVSAQVNRKICISVDDLPLVKYRVDAAGHEWQITNGILAAFEEHEVPGIGYVNAGKLFPQGKLDSSRIQYLQKWLDEGFELGNHTYAHKNYHRVSSEEFFKDILDGEKVVKQLVEESGGSYRFFRHPYLRSGMDSTETAKLKSFLQDHGYQEAFVTVDDDDYLFALAYARAFRKGNEEQMTRIGNSYLEYMVAKLKYFEEASVALFGRNINHTLLIHANFLNATYLSELLSRYQALGYSFISQEEAISDPAYNTPVTKFGDWGISWIHKWGMSQGVDKAFFEGDPPTPDFIIELSN